MVKITIMAERSLGHDDEDLSIMVADSGYDGFINVDYDLLSKKEDPKVEPFTEYYGCNRQYNAQSFARTFHSVNIGDFYMLWVDERKEWCGLYFHNSGSCSELDGTNEWLKTSGPYRLDAFCGGLICKAYRVRSIDKDVTRTSPSDLEALAKDQWKWWT